jgi:hypothetical protein
MKKSLRPVLAAAMAVGVAALTAGSASASAPTGDHAKFRNCPYTNSNVQACLYSVTSSGSFKLGNATVPITSSKPIILQGGTGTTDDDGNAVWYNAVGTDSLSKTRLDVPGGLVGLVSTGGWSGVLIDLFNAAVRSVNGVTATAELVGSPVVNYGRIIGQSGTGVGLPVRIHLENPFLGPNCYIGSSSNPVQLNLTTGTTAPPAPNTPISGYGGDLSFPGDGTILQADNVKLVNNSFAAPAASDCGYLLLDKLLITAGVNAREGLPAAAGKNTAILSGTQYVGYIDGVRASVQ